MNPSCVMWSASQRKAFEKLCQVGDAFFHADWGSLALKPRFDSLIIGPSGAGKSHLSRAVAEHLQVPILKVSHGEWIVTAARAYSLSTIQRVRNFIRQNECGIIHIDELDKAQAGFKTEWSIAAFGEIFSLLDRHSPTPPRDGPWTDTELFRLKTRHWFLGSGTWQNLWRDVASAKIGFGKVPLADEKTLLTDKIRRSGVIPEELLFRFSARYIFIEPATEDDYRRAAKNFGLSKLAKSLRIFLDYKKAANEGMGARWLEETHAELLVQAWKKGRRDLLPPFRSESPAVEEDLPDIPL